MENLWGCESKTYTVDDLTLGSLSETLTGSYHRAGKNILAFIDLKAESVDLRRGREEGLNCW